jgi:hypothetical protein
MNRWISFFVLLLAMAGGVLFGQNQATWTPAEPDPGDTLTIVYDPSMGQLPATSEIVRLHWGINEKGHGNWLQPPEAVWPADSKAWADGKAVQSPMTKMGDGTWQVQIVTLDTFKTVHFVFTNDKAWDNNNAANWDIYLGGGGGGPVHRDWVTAVFYADVGPAIQNRGFTYGDTLEVRTGFFATATELYRIPLVRQGISSIYKGWMSIQTTQGDTLDYSYFAKKNGKDNWEVYYNYGYTGENQSEAQQRQITVPTDIKRVVTYDTVRSQTDSRRPPFFRNLAVIAQDVTVTLTCDVRPAYVHLKQGGGMLLDIQGTLNVNDPDSVFILGVAVNGPITGAWSNPIGPDWGPHLMTLDNKKMFDDGTHGDVTANDSVYSIQFTFNRDSDDVVGQEFKFGIGGGDNEGGFGNNHVENIDDFTNAFTIAAQFGSIDPYFYIEWDYNRKKAKTGIESAAAGLPSSPSLAQNYPNPFNPSTTLQYALPGRRVVTLSVLNLLGERVALLVDQSVQAAGRHTSVWNGNDLRGNPAGSGVYLVRLEADDFVQVRKMVLVK